MKGRWVGFCGVMVAPILFFTIQAVAAGVEVPDINACKVVTGEEVAVLEGTEKPVLAADKRGYFQTLSFSSYFP